MSLPRSIPALIFLAILGSSPLRAAPALGWSLGLGPQAGLDTLLRGVEARTSLGLSWQGWGLSLMTALAWDRSLDSGRGLLGLDLDLGPDLALELAWEYSLGTPSLTDPQAGTTAFLGPAGLPSHLGLSTRLASLPPLARGDLSLRAFLSWTSYQVLSIRDLPPSQSEADYLKSLAARQGFSTGFRASLILTWSPSLKPPIPKPEALSLHPNSESRIPSPEPMLPNPEP